MSNRIKTGILFFLLVLITTNTFPNLNQPLRFKRYSVYDGLASNTIQSVVQDEQGFLWTGTSNGLTRFDGYRFEPFKAGSNGNSLADNEIFSLLVTGRYLWIGTSKSIERLDLTSYELKTYDYSVDNVITGSIAQTPDGSVWFGKWGTGLYRYNLHTDQIEPVSFPGKDNITIFSIHTGTNGKLWIGTEKHGIFYFDFKHNQVKQLIIPQDLKNEKIQRLSSILEVDSSLYLACHGNGLFRYNLRLRELEPVRPVNHRSPNLQFSSVIADQFGNLWIAGDQSGLLLYNPQKNEIDHFKNISYDPTTLSDDVVKCVFFDRENNLWVGTGNNGLNQSDIFSGLGFSYYNLLSPELAGSSLHFTGIYMRPDGTAWLGTSGQGLYFAPNIYQNSMKVDLPAILEKSTIMALYEDTCHQLYISAYPNKFYRAKVDYTKRGPVLKNLEPQGLESYDIRSILPVDDQNFYLGTDGQGLLLWNGKKGIIKQYLRKWPQDQLSLPGNFIRSLKPGNKHRIWISTSEGFARMGQRTGQINSFFSKNTNELSDFRINSILESHDKHLWLATRKGIYRSGIKIDELDSLLDLNRPINWNFTNYSEENGLINNNIKGLIEDQEGYIWGSSEYGIHRIHPQSGKVSSYDRDDGLGGNIFSANGIGINPQGELLFIGEHGFSIVKPKEIRIPEHHSKVILENLYVMGKRIIPGQSVNRRILLNKQLFFTPTINLKHKENTIGIEFSALSYINPRGIEYEYMLAGFDETWKTTSAQNRLVTYTNLYPGSYYFKVRGLNSDLKWDQDPTQIMIRIKPPFWATWWFISIILVIIVLVIRLIIYLRIVQQKAIQKELESQIAIRTREISEQNLLLASKTEDLKKANQVKDIFFNIIAHDLINPVSSTHQLIELIDRNHRTMEAEEMNKVLGLAVKSTKQTLDLLQNLLLWARSQSKSIVYKKNKTEMHLLVSAVVEQLKQQSKQKEITLLNQIDRSIFCFADELTMQTVFRNLLSNAIKFSFPGSYIQIGAIREGKEYQIFVKDQGMGISPETLANLFNPDHNLTRKGTQGEKGTGLGLKLCHDFVEGNDGTIRAESIEGKGTTIWVSLKAAQ